MKRLILILMLSIFTNLLYGLGEPPAVAKGKIVNVVSENILIITVFTTGEEQIAREVISKEESVAILEGVIPDGKVDIYDENDILIADFTFKDNKLNGSYRYYYKDGIIKEKGDFVNNILTGHRKAYDEKGRIKMDAPYKEDKKYGSLKTF